MKICVLSSGSKGNCTYVKTEKHNILIDIGMSSKYIEQNLSKIGVEANQIDIVLITHSHLDHIRGLKTFSKKYHPLIYVSNKILEESHLQLQNVTYNESFLEKNGIKVESIQLSHDVSEIRGYIIEEQQSSMVYITDTGYINEKYFDKLKNKTLYVFESNHDIERLMNNDNYPYSTKMRILSDKGHLSNSDAAYYLSKLVNNNTKYIVLAHLSEQNNTESLAMQEITKVFSNDIIANKKIFIARQDETTEVFNI